MVFDKKKYKAIIKYACSYRNRCSADCDLNDWHYSLFELLADLNVLSDGHQEIGKFNDNKNELGYYF